MKNFILIFYGKSRNELEIGRAKKYWKNMDLHLLWIIREVCHFSIFFDNLEKYLPKKAVYMVSE